MHLIFNRTIGPQICTTQSPKIITKLMTRFQQQCDWSVAYKYTTHSDVSIFKHGWLGYATEMCCRRGQLRWIASLSWLASQLNGETLQAICS